MQAEKAPIELLSRFGERIKLIRKDKKITQPEFGERIGVVQSFISAVERGEKGLGLESCVALSVIFGVNLHWLLTGQGEMYGPQSAPPADQESLEDYRALAKLLRAENSRLNAEVAALRESLAQVAGADPEPQNLHRLRQETVKSGAHKGRSKKDAN